LVVSAVKAGVIAARNGSSLKIFFSAGGRIYEVDPEELARALAECGKALEAAELLQLARRDIEARKIEVEPAEFRVVRALKNSKTNRSLKLYLPSRFCALLGLSHGDMVRVEPAEKDGKPAIILTKV